MYVYALSVLSDSDCELSVDLFVLHLTPAALVTSRAVVWLKCTVAERYAKEAVVSFGTAAKFPGGTESNHEYN